MLNIGKLDSRAPVEHRPEKKSYPEAVVQNSGENFNHVKNARADAVTSKTGTMLYFNYFSDFFSAF